MKEKTLFSLSALCIIVLTLATAILSLTPGSSPIHASGSLYVALDGDDAGDCLSPVTPCATINGAIAKASPGDAVRITKGIFAGPGVEVVTVDKDVSLSGGWNESFSVQNGSTTIDGQSLRRGIHIDRVSALIERFVVQNGASGVGAGVWVNYGTLTLIESSIRANTALQGGGMHVNYGEANLTNVTVSGNRAEYDGGGIGVVGLGTAAIVRLDQVTVSDNTAGVENAMYLGSGGGISSRAQVYMQNSIVAGNSIIGGDSDAGEGPDCAARSVISYGYNLIGDTSDCTFTSAVGDQTDIDARLGPLRDNGGDTYTHALLPGSPAINAGDPTGCKDHRGNPLPNDQRGFPRSERCDIGALELQPLEASEKTASVSAATPGKLVSYSITLRNLGEADLNNVIVTDTLPAELTYSNGSLSARAGSYGYNNGVIGWSGTVTRSAEITITFDATVNQSASFGSFVDNSAVINAGDWVFTRTADVLVKRYEALLPNVFNDYCSPRFFDDFSYLGSGWSVDDDDYIRTEYLNGEYRILTKQSGYFYLYRAPTCARENYTVEVDARWVGAPGSSYGLLFGLNDDYSRYYLFDMNTDFQQFRVLRRDPSGFVTIVPISGSGAINGGSASNHLKVSRNGGQFTLEVNGTVLGTWFDSAIGGLTDVGLVSSPYRSRPVSDARFDNFSVVTLGGVAAASTSSSANAMSSAMQYDSMDPITNDWLPTSD